MEEPIFTSAAHRDLAEIAAYIGRDRPGAALAWVENIEAKCRAIAASPSMGDLQPRLGQGVRATALGRYVILFREDRGGVEILRVMSGDRDIRSIQRD